MKNYRVTWEIDLSAKTPEDAAVMALAIHRDPTSIATVFAVTGDGDVRGRAVRVWVDVDPNTDEGTIVNPYGRNEK
jgi:hypothetical protein